MIDPEIRVIAEAVHEQHGDVLASNDDGSHASVVLVLDDGRTSIIAVPADDIIDKMRERGHDEATITLWTSLRSRFLLVTETGCFYPSGLTRKGPVS